MIDNTPSLTFDTTEDDFYPDNGKTDWMKYFKEFDMPIHVDSCVDPQLFHENLKCMIDDALKVVKDGLSDYYGVHGFIRVEEPARTAPFRQDYLMKSLIPMITPKMMQEILDKIERLEEENRILKGTEMMIKK